MTGARRGDPALIIVLGVVAVALVAGYLLLRGAREVDIPRSPVGFQGLVEWLEANGVEARRFDGGGLLSAENTGLRLYPIHDDDLDAARVPPETDREYILQTGEADQIDWVVRRKAELLNSLVILPKWRSGMRLFEVAHEVLLVPEAVVERVLGQFGPPVGLVREAGFREFVYAAPGEPERRAAIFAPQLLRRPAGCEPLIGTRDAMLLGKCRSGASSFLLLADPDLLDNHGLTLGDNAEIALALARRFGSGGPVVYDTTIGVNTVDPAEPPLDTRDRSWEDLARIFAWPFAVVWVALVLLAALVLWRSWVRHGPAARPIRDGLRAAKEVSIAAKGRLLRLSGHDLKLLEDWTQSRAHRLAAEILGPHRPAGDPVAQVAKATERRNPALAREFEGAMRGVGRGAGGGERVGEAELVRRLDRLEKIVERVLDEFGRAAKAGR